MGQKKEGPPDNGKLSKPSSIGPGTNKLPPKLKDGGKGAKSDDKDRLLGMKKKEEEQAKLLAEIRKRFERCISAESDNRKAALDDKKFLSGEGQWPADVAAQRNFDRRPCLTINKLPTFVNQITNDQRQNRPSINVSPVGDRSDPEVAKFYRGLIRNIERESAADIAYDSAFHDAASVGWGYFLITTEYESPKTFNQVIRIARIRNVFVVYLDPDHQDPTGADAKYGFISNLLPRHEYEEKYPNADPLSFQQAGTGEKHAEWVSKDNVRIVEYYRIETKKKKLLALSTGWIGWEDEVSDEIQAQIDSGEVEVENEREAEIPRVMWYKVNAVEVLEETEIPCDYLPIVKITGNELDVEGKLKLSGIVRNAKQPQLMYNYMRTLEVEVTSLQPKAPFVAAEGQVDDYMDEWKNANTSTTAVLRYKPEAIGGQVLPAPQRQPFQGAPGAVVQSALTAAQDMMATTGIRFDATMQERTVDESGRALREIRRTGDIGSFHYVDNLGRSLKRCGEILINMIPRVYDTKQITTILREDDSEEVVQIDPNAPKSYQESKFSANHPTRPNKTLKIFNPTIGKYGVTVTIGPSYATKRIEASESMMDFVRAVPTIAPAVVDLIAKNADWPGGEEFATRLAKLVAQQHPGLMSADPKDVPPQVIAMLQSMDGQIKQLMVERQQMIKMLTDQQADRAQKQDEIDKNFEAKLLKVVADVETKTAATQEKAVASFNAHIGSRLEELGKGVAELMAQLNSQSMGITKEVKDEKSN